MSRSNPSTPSRKRKRLRSMTPSEAGLNGHEGADGLRSPLAKRKKMIADRGTSSRLKETVSLADLDEGGKEDDVSVGGAVGAEEEEEEDDEEEEEEDDFLLREMEEMGEDEDDGDLEEVG